MPVVGVPRRPGGLTEMVGQQATKVLSVHWGFGTGGVANYAVQFESVRQDGGIELRSLVFLKRGRQADRAAIARLQYAAVVDYAYAFYPVWLRSLRDVLRAYRPHFVISHGFNGHFIVFLARMLGWLEAIPIVTYHGPYHPMSRVGWLKKHLFDKFTYYYLKRHAVVVLSVAGHEARALGMHGVDKNKITVIHNGIVDVEAGVDARTRLRSEWRFRDEAVVIGIVSRLENIKGIADAIEAFALVYAECPAVRLVVVGSGSQEGELRQRVGDLGLHEYVVFAGFRADTVDCYAAMDIFLLPSLSECHSIALLEAMRAALPIVATAVGGNVETVVSGVEAELVPAGAPREIAGALLKLVHDAKYAHALADAARRRYLKDFTASVVSDKTRAWLRAIGS